jgi:hypothetical protein
VGVAARGVPPPPLSLVPKVLSVPERLFEDAVYRLAGVRLPPGPMTTAGRLMQEVESRLPRPLAGFVVR